MRLRRQVLPAQPGEEATTEGSARFLSRMHFLELLDRWNAMSPTWKYWSESD
ncbi:hypothetical protein NK6_8757 [Bradyrhizobium diazoefficiens]|uniref:Uncharacterized protein n=1 Tax=Bradyrhizobium diazoefficiens TaxID=1355477 RepID=A0A0E4BWJ2_9BRAD|nr:hypothetical protein NK6_8757 [Bradyrhizobium diazoefficiens]